jgi:hypothetical protein
MSASQLKQVAMESKCDPLGVKKIPHGRFQGDQKNCPTLFMKVLDLFCHVALALSSRFVKFFKSFSIKHHQPFRALRHLPFFFRNSRYSREEKRRECHYEWHYNAPRPHAGIQEKWALHNLTFNLKVAFLVEADGGV